MGCPFTGRGRNVLNMDTGNWWYRRLQGIIDNLIASAIVAVAVAVWGSLETMPPPAVFVIALASFVLILVALRLTLSFADRKHKSDALAKIEKQQNAQIRFYDERQPLGWFRDKVRSARIIWAAYLIGGSTNNSELLKTGNFKRLVLLHPGNPAVKAIQTMESDKSLDSLQNIIHELTDFAERQNCDVRWCQDVTYSLLTIGNPPTGTDVTPPDDMWILVEAYLPGIEAEKRPSFLVERSNNQKLADKLLVSYNKLWEHSKSAT